MSLRDVALAACEEVVPSAYPQAPFQKMTGGMFQPGHGSSCGFLTSFVLYRIGVRTPTILNRNTEQGNKYMPGANISRLVSGAKALGAWRTIKANGPPQLGDCVFYSNGPPLTEHVNVIHSIDGNTWNSFDGGHPTAASSGTAQRTYNPSTNTLQFVDGPRTVQGYVDIESVPIEIPTIELDPEPSISTVIPPQQQDDSSSNFFEVLGWATLGLGVVYLFWKRGYLS